MTTKLQMIPTPVQARILKALAINNGLHIIWPGKGMAEWTGTNWPTVKREIGNLLASTVRRLSQEEWIEPDQEGSIFWIISEEGHAALERHGEIELVVPEVTAHDLLKAIKYWHASPIVMSAAVVAELHISDWKERRVDAFAISPSGDTWAYEIKISRADWLRELAEPEKRRPAQEIAQQFYFVAPRGVIELDELPPGCGLMLYEDGKLEHTMFAAIEYRKRPTWELVGAIARRLSE